MANGKKDPPKSIGKAVVKTLLDPFGVSKSIDKIKPVENIYEMGKKFYAPIINLFGKEEEDAKQASQGGVTKNAPKLTFKNPKESSTVYRGKPKPPEEEKKTEFHPLPKQKQEFHPLPNQKADPHPIMQKTEKTYKEKFINPRHDLIEGDKNL